MYKLLHHRLDFFSPQTPISYTAHSTHHETYISGFPLFYICVLAFYLDLILRERITEYMHAYVILYHGNCSFRIIMRKGYSLLNYIAYVQGALQNMFSEIFGIFSIAARVLVACNIPPSSSLSFGSFFKAYFHFHLLSGSQPSHHEVPNFLLCLRFPVYIISCVDGIYGSIQLPLLPHLISITQLHHNTHSMKSTVQS